MPLHGNGILGKLLGLVLATLLPIATAACGASPTNLPATQSNSSSASAEKTYQLGESAQLFDFKLTIDDVQKTDSYNKQVLQEGTEFVLVKVTLENTGSEKKSYHYGSFDLISSDPKPDLNVTTLNNQAELHEGDLAPGETVSGILPFEHPKGDPVMKLLFRPNKMAEQKIIFQLIPL